LRLGFRFILTNESKVKIYQIFWFLPRGIEFHIAFRRCRCVLLKLPSGNFWLHPSYCCITSYHCFCCFCCKSWQLHQWNQENQLISQFQKPHFYLYYFLSLMSSAKVARFKLNLLNLSRYLLMSCASLGFVPTRQKMRGVTPHFNLNTRCYHCHTRRKHH